MTNSLPPATMPAPLVKGTSTAQSEEEKSDLRKYREWLVSAEMNSQDQFDKAVLSLSGGALGISLVFLKDVVGTNDVKMPGFLMTSWMAWGLSTVAVLASFYLSHIALRRAISQVDSGTIHDQRAGGSFSIATAVLNAAGAALFLVGVCFIIAFAYANFSKRGVEHGHSETTAPAAAPVAEPRPIAAPGADKKTGPGNGTH